VRHRGVIEGFYGEPWPHAERLWLLERLGRWGMNLYVYAPKNDPLHRERWREPYPSEAMHEFAELIERGRDAGVEVGWAVSPGLSIEYGARADRDALIAKLAAFARMGSRFLCLAVDDVPGELAHEGDRARYRSLADAHVDLVRELADRFGSDATLCVVPTDYLGVEPTPYLETLGAGLDPGVEVCWTGRTVVSPTILAAEARRRAETLRRPVLLWDNVPVSDGPMRPMLHFGPYGGREAGIAPSISGALLNPMERARASAVALRTAAHWLADPEGYEPEAAWRAAVEEAGAGAVEALWTFAQAHRFSAQWPEERDRELEAACAAARGAIEEERDPADALAAARRLLEERSRAADAIREGLEDRALARELAPWLESHARETRRMLAALDAIGTAVGDGPPSARALGLLGFEARLTRLPAGEVASYGPRRVLYPQLVSMQSGSMRLGDDPALVRGRCLADEWVAFAEEVALRAASG
jgi:hyaluronoglucosaminidase